MVIKSTSLTVLVEFPSVPALELPRFDYGGGVENYEKSPAQKRVVIRFDWAEKQARSPAKNNLLNATGLVLSRLIRRLIYTRFETGRRKRGSSPRNLAGFAFRGERLDYTGIVQVVGRRRFLSPIPRKSN